MNRVAIPSQPRGVGAGLGPALGALVLLGALSPTPSTAQTTLVSASKPMENPGGPEVCPQVADGDVSLYVHLVDPLGVANPNPDGVSGIDDDDPPVLHEREHAFGSPVAPLEVDTWSFFQLIKDDLVDDPWAQTISNAATTEANASFVQGPATCTVDSAIPGAGAQAAAACIDPGKIVKDGPHTARVSGELQLQVGQRTEFAQIRLSARIGGRMLYDLVVSATQPIRFPSDLTIALDVGPLGRLVDARGAPLTESLAIVAILDRFTVSNGVAALRDDGQSFLNVQVQGGVFAGQTCEEDIAVFAGDDRGLIEPAPQPRVTSVPAFPTGFVVLLALALLVCRRALARGGQRD